MNEIEDAVASLRAGGVVAFPTETVYGLGADARVDRGLIQCANAGPAGPRRGADEASIIANLIATRNQPSH